MAGSVATTIGGSAAAATAVTGMMGSSVGAASMIAGFGYYGGRVTADHMARRIGKLADCSWFACVEKLHARASSALQFAYIAILPALEAKCRLNLDMCMVSCEDGC